MKSTLFLISFIFFKQIFCQDIFFYCDSVYNLDILNDSCFKKNNKVLDGNRIYLFDITKCKNSNSKLIVLKKENDTFYCEYELFSNVKFNKSLIEIEKTFKSYNKKERVKFQDNTIVNNNNYYLELRKIELKKNEEKKRINDSIEEVKKHLIEIEKFEKEEARKEREIDSNNILIANKLILDLIKEEEKIHSNFNIINEKINIINKYGGVLITKFNVKGDENSVDLEFEIFNCTKKRIKYLEFNVRGYNNVGDQEDYSKTLKGIGFIEAHQYGNWSFDNVWFSSIINSAKIISIKIIFEDGTIKNVTDVSKIIDDLNEEDDNFYSDFFDLYENKKNTTIGTIMLIQNGNNAIIRFKDLKNNQTSNITVDSILLDEINLILNRYNNENFDYPTFHFNLIKNFKTIEIYSDNRNSTVMDIKDFINLRDKLTTLKFE